MKKVIFIEQPKEETKRPVEFTHYYNGMTGWGSCNDVPDSYEKVVYLGKCILDGDMFAAFTKKPTITIFKGHLNSGEY